MKKFPKISASGRNFLDPLPSSKKGPTDENDGISYLIVIIKFVFFQNFNPPPLILQKDEPHRFYKLRQQHSATYQHGTWIATNFTMLLKVVRLFSDQCWYFKFEKLMKIFWRTYFDYYQKIKLVKSQEIKTAEVSDCFIKQELLF